MTGEEREPLRVAIVDDHPMFRMGVVRGLEDEGGIVIVAEGANAGDAVSIYQRARPDISLLDLSMPGGGHAAIRGIRDLDGDASIVVLTASEDDNDVFEALKAGAKGYVLKGVRTENLIEQLRRIQRDEPPISPQIAHRILAYFRGKLPNTPVTDEEERADRLTRREVEILRLLGKGLTAADIGVALGITRNTCSTHIRAIYRKLGISTRAEAALEANRRGLV